MSGLLRFLRAWILLSVPAGLLLGRWLRANRRTLTRPVDRP